MPMQSNKPSLEGVTLETIVTHLSETIGWDAMADAVPVRCFIHDPSIKSSLTFLQRTPWAKARVEALYLQPDRADTRGDAGKS